MNIHDVAPSEISLAEQSQRTKKLFSVRFQMIVAGYKFGLKQVDMANVLGISRQLVHKAVYQAKGRGLLDDETLSVTERPPKSLIEKVKQACIDFVN